MEKHEKDKITACLPDLIVYVECNSVLISYLKSRNVLSIADDCHLMSFGNRLDRSKELLDILCGRIDGYRLLVEGLRKTGQSGALHILEEPFCQETNQNSPATPDNSEILPFKKIPFQTKEATELFTGRSSELQTLLNILLPDGGTASITGIGGIGKTELAKMLLCKLEEEKKNVFQQIIWINCESVFTATTDFTNVAKDYLKIPIVGSSNQQRDITSILNDVYEKLKLSKSLVILDNIEIRESLKIYMPDMSRNGKLSILITSQVLKIGTNIFLGGLDLKDAIYFVKKGLELSDSLAQDFENGISDLVVRFEMLPLAISQAIAYIKEKREMHKDYEPKDYLLDLDRNPERVLDRECEFDLSSNGKTIYQTLTLALSKIETCSRWGLLASKILSKVAFMSPDNIPSNLFLELAENDIDAIEEALVLIRRFSVVTFVPVEKSSKVYFSIHRLVQDVLRIRISLNNETENSLQSTMELLSLNLNFELIDHALVAWTYVNKVKILVQFFPKFPYSLTYQINAIGRILDAYKFSTSALSLLIKNLSIKEHALSIFLLQGYTNFLLGIQGQYDDSLTNLQTTLVEAKKYLTVDERVIFQIRFYIAYIFFESGQNEKAGLISDEMYEDFKLQNNTSLRILYDIGWLQNYIKRFLKAEKTVKYILDQLAFNSVKDSRLEYDTKVLYANILVGIGNYCESINLLNEVVLNYFDDNTIKLSNYNRWRVLHNTGYAQYCAGLLDEAHDSYEKALSEMHGQKESECSVILYTKCNIALIMTARGMIDEALPYSEQVYEQMKLIFGKMNHWILRSLGNIGICYSKMGRHDDAVKVLTQLNDNETFVIWSADEIQLVKYYLALSLEQIGRFQRANEILSEVRLKCLENPNFKLMTIDQVDGALNRIQDTKTKKLVLSTVYKINKLHL